MARRTGRKKVKRKRYRVYLSRRSTHYIDLEAEDATRAGWLADHLIRGDERKLKEYRGSKDQVYLVDTIHELRSDE